MNEISARQDSFKSDENTW